MAQAASAATPADGADNKDGDTLPSWLLVGDKALARDKAALQRLRIKYVVNCTPSLTEGGVANYFQTDTAFEYFRVPIRDVATENILPSVPAAVEFLQRARVRADGRALVHCNEGKSRSAAIATAFLIRAYGRSADRALAAVRAARTQAQPKDAFLRQLATLQPATLETEGGVDGFAEAAVAATRTAGPSVGPAARPAVVPAIGPSLGPAARPAVGPAIGPSLGPAARPAVGPAIGPAPPSDEAAAGESSDDKHASKRGVIGPAPPPAKRAAIGPAPAPQRTDDAP
jgi:hypothetical protein